MPQRHSTSGVSALTLPQGQQAPVWQQQFLRRHTVSEPQSAPQGIHFQILHSENSQYDLLSNIGQKPNLFVRKALTGTYDDRLHANFTKSLL